MRDPGSPADRVVAGVILPTGDPAYRLVVLKRRDGLAAMSAPREYLVRREGCKLVVVDRPPDSVPPSR